MPPQKSLEESSPSWREYFGEAARAVPESLGGHVDVIVDRQYYLSVFRAAVVRSEGGTFTRPSIAAFLRKAVRAWVEAHREDKEPMSRERRTEVTVLVPGKAKRGAGARIRYVFENRTEENAVSRVLARRTDTTRAGRSIGMREALLERICDALAIVGRKEVTGASAHRDAAEVAR